jgi:heme O synthase-like polyprenyltransferase
LRDDTDRAARQMFRFSLLYLFLILALLLVDGLARNMGAARW